MNVREIADMVGVSPSTVSLVLNNKPGVRKEIRKKIATLLVQHGYSIKKPMQSKGRCFQLIRFKSTDHLAERNDSYLLRIIDGVDQACRDAGYSVSIVNTDSASLSDTFLSARESNIDGIIFLASEYLEDYADVFDDKSLPIVCIDNLFFHYNISCINADNRGGVYTAIKHLYDLGHRKIGYLKSTAPLGSLMVRSEAFYSSMAKFSLDVNPKYVVELDLRLEKAFSQMDTFLKGTPELPTAFFADNDVIAAGAIRAMQQNGLNIPDDISVVGFDNSTICAFITPPLTTINVNNELIGKLAVRRLTEIIDNKETVKVVLSVGVNLVERSTTAIPRQE